MRPSSAAWSGPARAGCCCTPCPTRDTLRAAGVVKVVEQTWRLDTEGPTGNSSARIGSGQGSSPAVQQAREGEAWFIARGRFEHLMVARTRSATATGQGARPGGPGSVLAAHRGLARCSHLGRGVTGRPGGPERPPRASGHRAAARRRWRRPGVVHAAGRAIGQPRPATGCASPWLRLPATATRTPPPPWSAKPPLTASTPPSWSPWPRPTGPSRGSTVAPRRPAGVGPRPACDGCTGPRPSGTGRTGAPAMTEARLRAIVTSPGRRYRRSGLPGQLPRHQPVRRADRRFPAGLGWAAPLLVDSFTLAASSRSSARPWPASGPSTPGAWSPGPPSPPLP